MSTFSPNPAGEPGVPQTSRPRPEKTSGVTQPAFEFDSMAAPPAPASRQPAQPQTTRKLTLGQVLVMAAGLLMFVWGFLPWYSDPAGGSYNAWSTATIPGLLLTATWVPLLSLPIAVLVAVKAFGSGLPDRVWGFSWAQLAVVAGLFDVLITFGFLVANRSLGSFASLNLGEGLILSFITALVMLAGGILDHAGVGAGTFSGGHQPVEGSRSGDGELPARGSHTGVIGRRAGA